MEKEIILSIEETEWESKDENDWSNNFTGYLIKTNKQTIEIGISDYQSCCENFGYLTTNDNLEDFIGSELKGIKLTDTELHSKFLEKEFEYGFDEGGIQFVDLETDKGSLQLAVYNSHNGYYGHSILIKSEQLTHRSGL